MQQKTFLHGIYLLKPFEIKKKVEKHLIMAQIKSIQKISEIIQFKNFTILRNKRANKRVREKKKNKSNHNNDINAFAQKIFIINNHLVKKKFNLHFTRPLVSLCFFIQPNS